MITQLTQITLCLSKYIFSVVLGKHHFVVNGSYNPSVAIIRYFFTRNFYSVLQHWCTQDFGSEGLTCSAGESTKFI